MRGQRRGLEGEGDSRCTPPEIWQLLLEAADLEQWTLDPASNAHSTIPAQVSFDGSFERGDGLGPLFWIGHVYLNPPFSDMLTWADRAFEELDPEDRAGLLSLTFLAFASIGTRWHRRAVLGCDAFATWDRRLDFPHPGEAAGAPPAAPIVYYGAPGEGRERELAVERWRDVLEGAGHLTHGGRRGREGWRSAA